MKRALMYASVASMIDLFNMENIKILQSLGYHVDVACNFEEGSITSKERVEEFKRELGNAGIKTFQIPIPRSIKKIEDIRRSYQLTKKLCKNNYDLVHCHSPIGSVICRAAFKKNNVRMIYTAHGFHFYKGAPKKNWVLFYPVEKYFARFTDTLITINNEDYKLAKNNFAEAGEIILINGIGIDTDKYSKKNIERHELFPDNLIEKSDFLIISVGQLSVRKNHEEFIRAISKLKNPNIKYIIIGEGELRGYLEKLITDLKLEKQVFLLGYKGNVDEYLSISDLYAFPSLQEGLPASLMEAMSVGLPAIVSDIRGNRDLIIHDRGGCLFSLGNEDSLVNNLGKLINNRKQLKKFGKFNQNKITEFDTNQVNKQMLKIYSS